MSYSGITSINELPRSNMLNNNVNQEYMMQQQPQNIVLNKNEIVMQSNNQMPGMDSLIPNGGYSTQNPLTQNQNNSGIMENNVQNQVQQQQPNYNELISQIQKAAANGTTALPSRDIPIDPIKVANDNQTQPNYIPPPQVQENYIKNYETPQQIIEEKQLMGYTWIKNLFWKLEEVSCVLVLRNKKWFQDNVHTLKELWGIIEKERNSGFEHRAPKKRIKKEDVVVGANLEINSCLLNIDKSSGKISVGKLNNTSSISDIDTIPSINPGTNVVIKIRTESFDETKK